MRWQVLILHGENKIGEDELGNAVTESIVLKETVGRRETWTQEEIDLLGRDFTKDHTKIATPASLRTSEGLRSVEFGGVLYTVTSIGEGGQRWHYIHAKRYRQ